MKKYNIEEQLLKLKEVHNNKYDYSKVEYKGWNKKVCIICPIHGEFWQTLYNHKTGQGCPKCGKQNSAKKLSLTLEEFIKKATQVHGDKYDYSKVIYVNNSTKICIICPEHGEFWQTPGNHLSGSKCPKCSQCFKNTNIDFIEKAKNVHGNKYDYSKVNYINNYTKVCIICPEHGEFWQSPNHHLKGENCPYCALNKKLEKSDFIRKSKEKHNNKYNYSKINFINTRTKVCIICPEHGEFWQIPKNHMDGHGCPKCASKESILEKEVINLLNDNNIEFIFQYKIEWLKYKYPMSLDFYIPKYNIAIECQGEQHFKPIKYFGGHKKLEYVKKRDKIKKELCENHNIKILYYSHKKFSDEIITDKNELIKIIN